MDDAARTRKLLAKNEPTKLNGTATGSFQLGHGAAKELGEHAVLVIVTNTVRHQLTISRPIGITDLDEGCWVANRTDDVPSMITRRDDPSQGAINQRRAARRSELAVAAGLLIKGEQNGRTTFFYPHDSKVDRNAHLFEAEAALKKEKARTRQLLEAEKSDPAKRNANHAALAKLTDRTQFLDAETAPVERELLKFYADPELVEYLEHEVPQVYRTRGGPFGDTLQCAIDGSRGLSLDAVVNGLVRDIVHGRPHHHPNPFLGSEEAVLDEEEEFPAKSTSEPSLSASSSSVGSKASSFLKKLEVFAKGRAPKALDPKATSFEPTKGGPKPSTGPPAAAGGTGPSTHT